MSLLKADISSTFVREKVVWLVQVWLVVTLLLGFAVNLYPFSQQS